MAIYPELSRILPVYSQWLMRKIRPTRVKCLNLVPTSLPATENLVLHLKFSAPSSDLASDHRCACVLMHNAPLSSNVGIAPWLYLHIRGIHTIRDSIRDSWLAWKTVGSNGRCVPSVFAPVTLQHIQIDPYCTLSYTHGLDRIVDDVDGEKEVVLPGSWDPTLLRYLLQRNRRALG